MQAEVITELRAAIRRLGIADEGDVPEFTALTGGVSSDIWKVETSRGVWCLKRALGKLKVQQDWRVPVSRSRNEYDWIVAALRIVPSAAPSLAGYDAETGVIAMRYYPPSEYKLWKAELAGGRPDPAFASAVGDALARIHAGTAGDVALSRRFDTGDIFHAIRLEPYLLATARAVPALASRLEEIVRTTAANRRTLVHGDVSPKNILIGPDGPMFLDAECAWYGDPAFDLAFCLNHMLLKCVWVPEAAAGFMTSFEALASAYLARVDWESPDGLEARAARLLPGLFLARVDGKSPVEYITAETDKDRVRRVAIPLIDRPVAHLDDVRAAWRREIMG